MLRGTRGSSRLRRASPRGGGPPPRVGRGRRSAVSLYHPERRGRGIANWQYKSGLRLVHGGPHAYTLSLAVGSEHIVLLHTGVGALMPPFPQLQLAYPEDFTTRHGDDAGHLRPGSIHSSLPCQSSRARSSRGDTKEVGWGRKGSAGMVSSGSDAHNQHPHTRPQWIPSSFHLLHPLTIIHEPPTADRLVGGKGELAAFPSEDKRLGHPFSEKASATRNPSASSPTTALTGGRRG